MIIIVFFFLQLILLYFSSMLKTPELQIGNAHHLQQLRMSLPPLFPTGCKILFQPVFEFVRRPVMPRLIVRLPIHLCLTTSSEWESLPFAAGSPGVWRRASREERRRR